MISGMLDGDNRCISVVVSEDSRSCNTLYESLRGLLTQESQMFRKVTMQEMLAEHIYMYCLLAPNQRWVIGHLAEHFLPDSLFEQLLEQAAAKDADIMRNQDSIRNLHRLNQRVLESAKVHMMIYESAFSDWIVSDTMDFYNCKVTLTSEQKCAYLNHFLTLGEAHGNLAMKMVHGRFAPDFFFESRQCIFLSNRGTYLRLDSNRKKYQFMLINRVDMQHILDEFFAAIWKKQEDIVISDWGRIRDSVFHTIQMIQMVADIEDIK